MRRRPRAIGLVLLVGLVACNSGPKASGPACTPADATVLHHDGPRLTVLTASGQRLEVPVSGFPDAFVLREGERTTLSCDGPDHVAVPLVGSVELPPGMTVQVGDSFEVDGIPLTVAPGAVLGPTEGGDAVAWFIEPGTAPGPARIVAIRSR